MVTPIFIFSLPRSGSTLLQRILMSHNEIASLAEPWILLPFLYTLKQHGTLTEYAHSSAYNAITNFINNLPNKQKDFDIEFKNFLLALYEKQCPNGETYFLDKTPRYYLIIPEIAKLFPDSKFIFLFRNPIHVYSSIIETWGKGSFLGLHRYDIDLKTGPKKLSEGFQLLKDKAYALQYEEFVGNPEKYTEEICNYLNIPFKSEMLINFSSQDTKGTMGDPTGTKKYTKVETKSLKKWAKMFNTSFRIKQAKKYISYLNQADIKTQGYNKNELLKSLDEIKLKQRLSILDFLHIQRWNLIVKYNLNIFTGNKTSEWTKGKYLS